MTPPSAVSPIGDSQKVESPFAAKSQRANTIALSYIASAMLNLGGSN